MNEESLQVLKKELQNFAAERNWDQFHSPKNLASALIVEAAELLEHFQWLTIEESASLTSEKREQVGLEMADVLIYLVRLADKLDVDLTKMALKKMSMNAEKYPKDRAYGSHKKYTEL